jgi:hypothetical protein
MVRLWRRPANIAARGALDASSKKTARSIVAITVRASTASLAYVIVSGRALPEQGGHCAWLNSEFGRQYLQLLSHHPLGQTGDRMNEIYLPALGRGHASTNGESKRVHDVNDKDARRTYQALGLPLASDYARNFYFFLPEVRVG